MKRKMKNKKVSLDGFYYEDMGDNRIFVEPQEVKRWVKTRDIKINGDYLDINDDMSRVSGMFKDFFKDIEIYRQDMFGRKHPLPLEEVVMEITKQLNDKELN
jgi:hypothetical protein